MDQRVRKVDTLLLQSTLTFDGSRAVSDEEGGRRKSQLLVEEAAEAVNLSPSRLRAIFRAEMGITPKRRIKQLKLERAKALVETTYLTINQILAIVDAGDPRHFRKAYKLTYGMSMTECRNRTRSRLSVEVESIQNDGPNM